MVRPLDTSFVDMAATSIQPPVASPADLMAAFRPYLPTVWRAFAFGSVGALLSLTPAVYMLEVYDRVVNSRSISTLVMLTLAVLMAYVVMECLEWVRGTTLHDIGSKVDRLVSPALFDGVVVAQLRRQPGGTTQPMSDWRTVREFVHSPFILALMEAPIALLFLAVVFLIHPLLGWVTLGSAIFQVILAGMIERATSARMAAANRRSHEAQQYVDGALRNAEVVEALGMRRDVMARWSARQREVLVLQAGASKDAGGLQAASKMIQQVMGSALIGLSALLLLRNELPGGAGLMIVASIIGARVLQPLVQMVSQWRSAVNFRDAWRRLNSFLADMAPTQKAMSLPRPQGHLAVEFLVAGPPVPPGRPPQPILRSLDFNLHPGQLLAVIGPSASGKTTLARSLVGLWAPISGKVRLDGADVNAWDKSELGPHIGYLPQNIELFEGTVAENIARFGAVNPEWLSQAVQAADLESLVAELPFGVQTPVGRDGAMLSAGQRQRIGLARALYGEPSLVVLDEPNSSLDEAGDMALAKALLALKVRGATVIVMTHRSGVVRLSDLILVLREGTQQAFGPRDQVLSALQKAQADSRQRERAEARPAASGDRINEQTGKDLSRSSLSPPSGFRPAGGD